MASGRKEPTVENVTQRLRQELTGASGPAALVKNIKVFWIACFACLGGSVYSTEIRHSYEYLMFI